MEWILKDIQEENKELEKLLKILVLRINEALHTKDKPFLETVVQSDEQIIVSTLELLKKEEETIVEICTHFNFDLKTYAGGLINDITFEKETLLEILNALRRIKITDNYDNLITVSKLTIYMSMLINARIGKMKLQSDLFQAMRHGIKITGVVVDDKIINPVEVLDGKILEFKGGIQKSLKSMWK